MSPLELVDDRFEKLSGELRASRPVASAGLRERVADLARVEPAARRRSFRLPSRRVAVALVAAAVLASLVVAGFTGLRGSGGQRALEATKPARGGPATASVQVAPQRSVAPLSLEQRTKGGFEFAPSPGRLQRYDAILRLRVKDVDALSSAARRATNLTRSLGGYVASVNYATQGGRRGGARLVLRVPIGNVQTALAELVSLGTIVRQHAAVLDVTRRAERESQQIAKLERQLADASPREASAIRLKLKALRAKHARLLQSAQLARITLSLTTPARQAEAPPSRFDRTLDDAGTVLVRELEILLYALVVAGPLLLLGGAAVAAGRVARRRSDRRLLERA